MKSTNFTTIDHYINSFPEEVKTILFKVRETIKNSAPNAEEKISYAIPTFTLNGNLIHFAAFKNHIGIYPGPSGINAFKKELTEYKTAKGSIQFPFNKPIPYNLIAKIVAYRVEENISKK
jgi:uncharacterized protein YdhG (YjbR/CyaY superfamily)